MTSLVKCVLAFGAICLVGSSRAAEIDNEARKLGRDSELSIDAARQAALKAHKFASNGRYAQALQLYLEALTAATAQAGDDHPDVASLMISIGAIYTLQAKFDQAQSYFTRAKGICEKTVGTRHVLMADVLSEEGFLQSEHLELANATLSYRLAMMILEGLKPKDTLRLAVCRRRLGQVYGFQAKFEEALHLLEQALAGAREIPGPEDLEVAVILRSMADVYQSLSDRERALRLLEQSREIIERKSGPDHPEIVHVLTTYSLLHMDAAKPRLAVAALEQALTVAERVYGPDHPLLGIQLCYLGYAYEEIGEGSIARDLGYRSLLLLEKGFGPHHPALALSYQLVGRLHKEAGELELASKQLKTALLLWMRSFGPDHAKTLGILNNLAETQAAAGDYESALESRLVGLNVTTNLYGLWSVQTANVVFHLAEIHMLRGEYGLSRTNYELAILGWRAHVGEDDLRISTGLNHLGILSWEEEKYEEALALLRRALDLRLRLVGHPDPHCVGLAVGMSWLAFESGKYGQSLDDVAKMSHWNRRVLLESTGISSHIPSADRYSVHFTWSQAAQSLLLLLSDRDVTGATPVGAQELAVSKALVEEVQAVQTILEKDSSTATTSLLEQGEEIRAQLMSLQSARLPAAEQETRRRSLFSELGTVNEMLRQRLSLSAQSVHERETSLSGIAHALPSSAVLCDFLFFYPIGSSPVTNGLSTPRYAAYLTFPLANGSTNVVVERVDLGEATPINEAVELICRRMGAGQFRAKDLEEALQRLSELVYAPLARHLTNVSHLIVCPDGQLSRVPFEMLLASRRGEPPRYLVEEKTVSYVGSGREVARLAQPAAKVTTNAPMVMGNPDFDLGLSSRSRREENQSLQKEAARGQ
jgi:tetratricopeptide (TPR) repeat protein